MSGKNQATHDYIVFELAQAHLASVRFDLAIDIVHGCQKTFGDAWEATRDAYTAMPESE
jgi:hypothetical protein